MNKFLDTVKRHGIKIAAAIGITAMALGPMQGIYAVEPPAQEAVQIQSDKAVEALMKENMNPDMEIISKEEAARILAQNDSSNRTQEYVNPGLYANTMPAKEVEEKLDILEQDTINGVDIKLTKDKIIIEDPENNVNITCKREWPYTQAIKAGSKDMADTLGKIDLDHSKLSDKSIDLVQCVVDGLKNYARWLGFKIPEHQEIGSGASRSVADDISMVTNGNDISIKRGEETLIEAEWKGDGFLVTTKEGRDEDAIECAQQFLSKPELTLALSERQGANELISAMQEIASGEDHKLEQIDTRDLMQSGLAHEDFDNTYIHQ